MLEKRDNFGIVANICVVQVLRTFYLNCVTPVASRAGGGHGGKHRNLPIFAIFASKTKLAGFPVTMFKSMK